MELDLTLLRAICLKKIFELFEEFYPLQKALYYLNVNSDIELLDKLCGSFFTSVLKDKSGCYAMDKVYARKSRIIVEDMKELLEAQKEIIFHSEQSVIELRKK